MLPLLGTELRQSDSLGNGLGFAEHIGLLGERDDTFASGCGTLLLELQI